MPVLLPETRKTRLGKGQRWAEVFRVRGDDEGRGGPKYVVIETSFVDILILRCLYHIQDRILNRMLAIN